MKKLPEITEQAMQALKVAVAEKHPVSNLEEIGVTPRMINLLHANNIEDMEHLMSRKREDLLAMQNFGQRQLEILFDALSKYHLIEDLS